MKAQKKEEACDVSAFVIADADLFVVDEHFELN